MAKFLILGDVHLRTATPEMRTEPEFDQVCLGKLEWCLSQAQLHECEAILCPGDFFDSPNPTSKLQARTLRLLKEYEIPIITTIGNHDVTGKTTSNFEDSALSLFHTSGEMIVLTGGEYIDFQDIGKTIRIIGYGYGEKETEQFIVGKTVKDDDVLTAALIHASIGNNIQEAQYAISDLNFKGADVAVIGDIHSGWNGFIKHKSGCKCFNAGCLIRQKINEADFLPRCYVYDTETEVADRLVVPHLKSNECFLIEKQQKRVDAKLEAFNAAHERSRQIQLERPEDQVRRVGRAAEFDEGIIDAVVRKLP